MVLISLDNKTLLQIRGPFGAGTFEAGKKLNKILDTGWYQARR